MIKETNQRIVKVHFKDDDFESMLSCKGIEVVFSEED